MHIGLDIGYSGLKLAFGIKGRQPRTMTLPIAAVPASQAAANYLGDEDGVRVMVEEMEYIACLDPYLVARGARSMDNDYPKTRQYRALYHAALKLARVESVDCVATGLPVSQYFNKRLRSHLAGMLQGRHRVDRNRVVEVRRSLVYPQPAGMYAAFLTTQPGGGKNLDDQTVLVIDPGFFTVDSVVIRHNRPYPNVAVTSTQAMSRVIEQVDEVLTREFADITAMPGRFKAAIEEKLRAGSSEITVHGRRLDVAPYLERAAAVAAEHALGEIAASLRELDFNIDIVLVAGGGARWYAPTIRQHFHRQRVVVMDEAPTANAYGFWLFAGNDSA